MKEATDVLAATARLLNAVAETLEKAANPLVAAAVTAVTPTPAMPEPVPTPRRKKAAPAPAAPAPAAAAAPAYVDPLMQDEANAPHAPLPPAAAASSMTEEQSAAKAAELAKALCNAFPEKEANNRPRGFNLAMGVLGKFKVARTSDLIHSQRLQFIAEAEPLLPKVAA